MVAIGHHAVGLVIYVPAALADAAGLTEPVDGAVAAPVIVPAVRGMVRRVRQGTE